MRRCGGDGGDGRVCLGRFRAVRVGLFLEDCYVPVNQIAIGEYQPSLSVTKVPGLDLPDEVFRTLEKVPSYQQFLDELLRHRRNQRGRRVGDDMSGRVDTYDHRQDRVQ